MRRKIIKQKSAYTITLPIDWVREYNLQDAPEIEVQQEGNNLIIQSQKQSQTQTAKIDITDEEEEHCRILIENHYLKGYDLLELNVCSQEAYKHVQQTVSNLIGFEITTQKDEKTVVSQTAMPTSEEFIPLLNRCLSIINHTLALMQESLEENTYTHGQEIEQMTKDARRFLLFLTRTIHKQTIVKRNEESFIHLLLERLILIQHNQHYLYEKLSKQDTPKIGTQAKQMFIQAKKAAEQFIEQLRNDEKNSFSEITQAWKQVYFTEEFHTKSTDADITVYVHSMQLAKLAFLSAQPNISAQLGLLTRNNQSR